MKLKAALSLIALVTLFYAPHMAHASEAGVQMRRESFLSAGRRIHVQVFSASVDDRARIPGLIVLHGAAGTHLGKRQLEALCGQLAQRHLRVFLVHYFDRTGTFFAGSQAIRDLTGTWLQSVHDAVDYVALHPGVRADSIGSFGYSLGAYLAVAEASQDRRIKALVCASGGILDAYRGHIHHLPALLILHGSADQRVPVSNALELQRTAKNVGASAQLKIYVGEPHRFSPTATADATRRSGAFLSRKLRP